ncbi:Oidioi.mRNA.OKI2018_I69.PAR.g8553.t1.cds [Oikopleura dioica]|uniref:Oidioi.mRNA.OKI2018_I69.PAR.g8553.t1.cds n=1 Tax=Oikopleura dioica TaxID=34765 RepID=A0ABN7RLX4_OIKDI|nr:Oidioi.mRNA.OKI2018_I69.PAR.g8553.t1.cds [Oikopleura dioica]
MSRRTEEIRMKADFVATIFFIPPQLYVNLSDQWLLGGFYCKSIHYLGSICDTYSVYATLLLGTAFDNNIIKLYLKKI